MALKRGKASTESVAAASAVPPMVTTLAIKPAAEAAVQAHRPDRMADRMADRVVDAILAVGLAPGQRLGEQALADLFGVSRTLVREAMGRLSARGMVEVTARRGWFVVQPSLDEAREAFGARLALETGLLHGLNGPLPPSALLRLKAHVASERAAIRAGDAGDAGDAGERSWLLGDFHVCLAECAGNSLLADILKDLTARTTLIATLYQSIHAASESCDEHAGIVAALGAGDLPQAIALLRRHIGSVAQHLGQDAAADDPLASLRAALTPLKAQAPPGTGMAAATTAPTSGPLAASRRRPAHPRLFTDLIPPASPPSPFIPPTPPNRPEHHAKPHRAFAQAGPPHPRSGRPAPAVFLQPRPGAKRAGRGDGQEADQHRHPD